MILIIGDPHFKIDNKKETDQLLKDTLNAIKERDPDFVVVLGDVYDDGANVNILCQIRVNNFLISISLLKPLYVLIGNHDRPNNKEYLTDVHQFNSYKSVKNITIVDRCHTIVWKNKRICMMPYVPNNMFLKALKDCNIDLMEQDLFFAHQEFYGCKINKLNGAVCDIWKKEYPLIISGHIHDKEFLYNLWYLGTPYQHGFNECSDKGIFLLKENLEIEQIKLNIKTKVHLKLNYKDLDVIKNHLNDNLKLTINGPIESVRKIVKKNKYIKEFKNIKIIYKDSTKNKKKKSAISNMSYENRILKGIEEDKKLKMLWQKYLGEDLFSNKKRKLK